MGHKVMQVCLYSPDMRWVVFADMQDACGAAHMLTDQCGISSDPWAGIQCYLSTANIQFTLQFVDPTCPLSRTS